MPALSPTMTEGAIGSWKVKEGPFVPSLLSSPPPRRFCMLTGWQH